jgi:Questin oxidase-like
MRYDSTMLGPADDSPDSTLERAWKLFHATDPEFGEGAQDGMSNHGPMAVEALVELGHASAVPEFVASYRDRLRPLRSGRVIPAELRHAAVGDPSRRFDWIATYHHDIEEAGPAAVVAAAVPELAGGTMAAAVHGLIRTAHAVRALRRRDTPTRRCELAHALGYWAARHQSLPGVVGRSAKAGQDVVQTLAKVPRVVEHGPRAGLIFQRVHAVRSLAGFVDAVESVDLEALPFDAALTAIIDAAAHLYLSTPSGRFVYLHAITSTSGVRLIAPWLAAKGQKTLLAGLFHALAALHATHARSTSTVHGPVEPIDFDPVDAAARAAASLDDHTIKLMEAVQREQALAPRPVLWHVAQQRLS